MIYLDFFLTTDHCTVRGINLYVYNLTSSFKRRQNVRDSCSKTLVLKNNVSSHKFSFFACWSEVSIRCCLLSEILGCERSYVWVGQVRAFWLRYWGGMVVVDENREFFRALGRQNAARELSHGVFPKPRCDSQLQAILQYRLRLECAGQGEHQGRLVCHPSRKRWRCVSVRGAELRRLGPFGRSHGSLWKHHAGNATTSTKQQ